jgi:hypothetical protein
MIVQKKLQVAIIDRLKNNDWDDYTQSSSNRVFTLKVPKFGFLYSSCEPNQGSGISTSAWRQRSEFSTESSNMMCKCLIFDPSKSYYCASTEITSRIPTRCWISSETYTTNGVLYCSPLLEMTLTEPIQQRPTNGGLLGVLRRWMMGREATLEGPHCDGIPKPPIWSPIPHNMSTSMPLIRWSSI